MRVFHNQSLCESLSEWSYICRIRHHLGGDGGSGSPQQTHDTDDVALIRNHLVRAEVQSGQLAIELTIPNGADGKRKRRRNIIEVPEGSGHGPDASRCLL